MDKDAFLARIKQYLADKWRLVLINTTSVTPQADADKGAYEISWTFEKDGQVEHVRHTVPEDVEVPSISGIYGCAFLYENEIRDLFGVKLTGIQVDFKGDLYRTAEKVPFSPRAIKARLEANKGKKK